MYKKTLMNKSIDAMICDIEKKHDLFFLKYRLIQSSSMQFNLVKTF
jgi:hypothetical protein